jgi:hypothetical protein
VGKTARVAPSASAAAAAGVPGMPLVRPLSAPDLVHTNSDDDRPPTSKLATVNLLMSTSNQYTFILLYFLPENIGVDFRLILKWNLKNEDVKVLIGQGLVARLFGTRLSAFGFYKMLGIS